MKKNIPDKQKTDKDILFLKFWRFFLELTYSSNYKIVFSSAGSFSTTPKNRMQRVTIFSNKIYCSR